MKKNRLFLFLALLAAFALVLSACGGGEDAMVDEGPALGTEENPIKMLFVPSVDTDFMIATGDIIEEGLFEATGLYFDVSVPTSYAATIEEMCASPDDTIGFIPAFGYVIAHDLCGVELGVAAARGNFPYYWTAFIVQRDSPYESLLDLEGKTWGYGSATSTSGYLYPSQVFTDIGLTIGDSVETGGHPETVRAVYLGEVDFGAVYFTPWAEPEGADAWTEDMDPDIPDDLIDTCGISGDALMCSGYTVRDARAAIREELPDVVQKVRILELSPPISNDTMSFSPDFPEDLKQTIIDGFTNFILEDPRCADSFCNESFYAWDSVGQVTDADYDGIRLIMLAKGIDSLADLE
jgi:phosphonate transport system substrate-binding protein